MIYVEIDDFCTFPYGALSRASNNVVTIRENGLRLGVMIPPDLYDLYQLYEKEHWERPKDERSDDPSGRW